MEKQLFPCPVCGDGLEVCESKKGKPYVICNGCGVQMFVRTEPGIRRFEKLVTEAEAQNIWARLKEQEQRYWKQCPNCGRKFWVEQKLIETSDLDGSFLGFRCPEEGCETVIKWER